MTVPESFQSRSFRFATEILRFYRTLAIPAEVPRPLADQMLRAGTAIGANLEEAKSAHSHRDLAAKYVIALREARECRYWLRLICVDRPGLMMACRSLIDECTQLVAILTTSVKKLRSE